MRHRLVLGCLLVVLVSGCSLAPGPSTEPSPTDALPADELWLSTSVVQALPPAEQFAWIPPVAITRDGLAVTTGPVPAIFPGPLVPPFIGRRISAAGMNQILQWAGRYRLLTGQEDFTGGQAMPGQPLARIRFTVDGRTLEVVGDPTRTLVCPPNADCDAAPGSPEAFALVWQRLLDLPTFLGAELGPEAPWVPAGYSILIGPAPNAQDLPQPVAEWPLDGPLATIGRAVADGRRCVTILGEDAAALLPALERANRRTPWVDEPGAEARFGLTVRPLLPGEDRCREIFGPG
jgi:hypothetical protein